MDLQKIDKSNYSALQYHQLHADKLQAICEPLVKHLNINKFTYAKYFNDGTYLFLSTQSTWQRFFLLNVHENPLIWRGATQLNNLPASNQIIPFLWPLSPNSQLTRSICEHGSWHGINFIKFFPDLLELWSFSTSPENHNMRDIYLRYPNVFIEFIHYFNYKAQELIELKNTDGHKHGHKLARFKNGFTPPNCSLLATIDSSVDDFLEEIRRKKFMQSCITLGKARLSPREFECLTHIARGKTAKQIAKQLQLSIRTIEEYTGKIKNKTGYSLRSDLVK